MMNKMKQIVNYVKNNQQRLMAYCFLFSIVVGFVFAFWGFYKLVLVLFVIAGLNYALFPNNKSKDN